MALGERTLTDAGAGTPLTVGEEEVVRVRGVAAGGAGVADLPDGRVVFIPLTAPGDLARIRVTSSRARWAKAVLEEVREEGPGRVAPPCPRFGRCGGCGLQHLAYEEQLRWKGRMVRDAIERIAGRDLSEAPEVEPSPERFRYRSRMSFHLRRLRGGRVVAGLHERDRPGRLVEVEDDCLLPVEPLGRVWTAVRAGWGPGARRLPQGRSLRLTLRWLGESAALLVEPGAQGPVGPGTGRAAELLEAVPDLRSVWVRPAGAEARLLAGEQDLEELHQGRAVRPRAGAFVQVNRPMSEVLARAVMEAVGAPGGRRVVDAYCGVGSWGWELARQGARVTGIELDGDAAAAALDGAPEGFTVLHGAVEELLDRALPADTVLVNPPRTGLHESVPARLRDSGVDRLVYVSCDPATLARDLDRLGPAWTLDTVRAFDLFPQTAHVETLVALVRVEGGDRRGPAHDQPERA
jgi:23S rRNA (uracil1939-C5)-methyltransferase